MTREAIRLTPIEILIAKPPEKRTAIEQVIVTAYCNGDLNAEKAAEEIRRLTEEVTK